MKRIAYRSILTLAVAGLILAAAPNAVAAHKIGAPVATRAQASPTFVFPSGGQTFPLNGSMLFQVQPMSGAHGYLWSFVQNGAVVWQNLAWEGRLGGATYSVGKGSRAEGHMHGGDMQVWVRAWMGGNQWSGLSTLGVRLQGAASGPVQPQPVKPQPVKPQPNILYQANWSSGMNGWSGPGWKSVAGMLVSDGSNGAPILAPYQPTTPNYAIEVEARADSGCSNGSYFTMVARDAQSGFYSAEVCGGGIYAVDASGNSNQIATLNNPPDPGHGWHTYRLEVKDNRVTLLYDGSALASATDNRYLDAGQVGLQASGMQVSVRSFKVIAL